MKWIKVAPPHIVSLASVAVIVFGVINKYELHSPKAIWFLGVPMVYILYRIFSRGVFSHVKARLNIREWRP